MRTSTTLAVIAAAAIATLSGCVVAPDRGDYRGRDRDHSYDHRYDGDRGYYRYDGGGRRQDGDHAGGTRTPD